MFNLKLGYFLSPKSGKYTEKSGQEQLQKKDWIGQDQEGQEERKEEREPLQGRHPQALQRQVCPSTDGVQYGPPKTCHFGTWVLLS